MFLVVPDNRRTESIWFAGDGRVGGGREDRIETGPPRARADVIYVDLDLGRYKVISVQRGRDSSATMGRGLQG